MSHTHTQSRTSTGRDSVKLDTRHPSVVVDDLCPVVARDQRPKADGDTVHFVAKPHILVEGKLCLALSTREDWFQQMLWLSNTLQEAWLGWGEVRGLVN